MTMRAALDSADVSSASPEASSCRPARPAASAAQAQASGQSCPVTAPSAKLVSHQPVTDITCYNCNKKGHIARDCPEPRRVIQCTFYQETREAIILAG